MGIIIHEKERTKYAHFRLFGASALGASASKKESGFYSALVLNVLIYFDFVI